MALRSITHKIRPAQLQRAAFLGSDVSAERAFYVSPEWLRLRAEIIKERGRRCQSCGASQGRIHLDHIVELQDGGDRTARSNLQLLCQACHTRKTTQERAKRLSAPYSPVL